MSFLCGRHSFILNLTIIRILRWRLVGLHNILIRRRVNDLREVSLSAHFGSLRICLISRRLVLLSVSRHLVKTIRLRLHVIGRNRSIIIVVQRRLHLPWCSVVAHRTTCFRFVEQAVNAVLRGALLPLLSFSTVLVYLRIAL